ncbi:FAD-dependent monooxygenase, partial [Streptomyces sp. UNOC14_S4]|uniref:FAD-dependent monooxygenase n=1 Tax=Streptomyces sp. UNOC14_S4 TaxID=2872340 RepID=UPI001E51F1C7
MGMDMGMGMGMGMDADGMNGSDFEVVVAGAGPTGLALACDLLRRGVRTLLVERGDRLFPGSRARELRPRTQEILDDLGVLATVRAVGEPHPPLRYWTDGEPCVDRDLYEQHPGPVPRVPVWSVPQWRTQEVLRTRLRELGGDVAFGVALTGLAATADGVELLLTHQNRTRIVHAAYAVGTDGVRGTVRAALGIARPAQAFDERPLIVADVLADGLDRDRWHIWPGAKGGALSLCPLACADTFRLLARYEDEPARPDTSEEGVRQLIADRTHLPAADVREVRCATAFRAETGLADSYRAGRVLLAGDAAHVHSPVGGQGLDTGVQDAYNLGWKLGMVLRHGADPALLDTYESERRPAAAEAIAASTRLYRRVLLAEGEPVRWPHPVDEGYRDSRLSVDTRPDPGAVTREGAGPGTGAG